MNVIQEEDRILQHKIEVEDKNYNDQWKTCCGDIDRRCLVYGIQMSLLFLIMGFCIFKLLHSADCNESQTYLGLLTMLVGLVIPNPSIND